MKILHVEVGGAYGGSLRALELYLAHSSDARLQHDVLFYFPTPHSEGLLSHMSNLLVLYPGRLKTKEKNRVATGNFQRNSFLSSARLVELKKWVRLAADLPAGVRIRGVIRNGRYDVVHVNNTFTYQPLTLIAARWSGVPVVAHVRNPVERRVLTRRLAKAANRLVCVNRSIAQELAQWRTGAAIFTCRDAVEEVTFDKEESLAFRNSLVKGKGLLIGALGRMETQKGFRFLVLAARKVVDQMPEVKFAVAGEGSEREELQGLVHRLGLEKNFILYAFRSDVGNFIKALDVFVVSSLWEGGPLTALEAMQLSKPIVTTPVGFMPELIRDRVNGLLVPASDVESLASTILELCRNANLRRSMGAAAPDAVRPFRDRAALAKDLDAVFASLG